MGATASVHDRHRADELGLLEDDRLILASMRRLAQKGTGEKTAAHGAAITAVPPGATDFVFGTDSEGDPLFGRIGDSSYDYRGLGIRLDSEEGWKKLQICAREDGMILVSEGVLLCGNYFAMDLRKGDNTGGFGAANLKRFTARTRFSHPGHFHASAVSNLSLEANNFNNRSTVSGVSDGSDGRAASLARASTRSRDPSGLPAM